MKKIFLALVLSMSIIAVPCLAQRGPVVDTYYPRDTTVNTDTSTYEIKAVGDNLASIDVGAVLLTGTIGGKFYLYGRTGTNYNLLDSSATLTASVPFKTFLFDRTKYTYYKDYKVQYRTTTTQTSYMVITTVRRPDED